MNEELTSELEHLVRIEKFMASMAEQDVLLAAIMGEGTAAVNSESCSLALLDEASGELYFYVAKGNAEEREFEHKLKRVRLIAGTGVVGWCLTQRLLVNIGDAYADPRFDPGVDRQTGFVTRSILAVPMLHRGKLIGVMEAVNKLGGGSFTVRDEKVLTVLAAQAALILENARLYRETIDQTRLSALGQGIAGAAHCIKNILNGIDGGAFILEAGLCKDNLEGVGKGWEILKRNTQIMKTLVLDMLTYSKPRQPEIEPCDLNRLCQDVADLLQEKARGRGVILSTSLAPVFGLIPLDPKGIYRCILNLTANAVDAIDKPDGRVEIITRPAASRQGYVEIAVSDNGCGISENNQRNMFKAFFSTKGAKGTGLGLAVTQKIVHEHCGDIHLDSVPGRGTTFIITLPGAN
ncbi:MAG: ATP-binding protein [Lentisphaerota bacterium]